MSLPVIRTGAFPADYENYFRWYAVEAGEDVAWRFERAVTRTLNRLSRHPELGRRRRFRHPSLAGFRSFRIEPPFNKVLLSYRVGESQVEAVRLMRGSRDLPRRLLERAGLD